MRWIFFRTASLKSPVEVGFAPLQAKLVTGKNRVNPERNV
jgi:hypothetical protein